MKKILITGTNGLLGQKLVYALRDRKDYQVIATARGENRLLEKAGYLYETLDITSAHEVEQVFLKHQPHIVIN